MNKWVLLLCGMLTACSAPQTKTTEGKDYYQIELGPLIAKGEHYIVDNPYTFSYDKKSGQAHYQKIIYPEYQYEFKEKSSFVPHFISTDGKYLIDFEQTKNESKQVIVLVER